MAVLWLPACATSTPDAAVATLDDIRIDPSRRLATLERLGPIDTWPDPSAGRATLERIVLSDRQPDRLRQHAIDRLIGHDPAAFRTLLDRRFLEIDRWPVILHIFDLARQQKWDDFTPMIVRSYARPSARYGDADRPERAVLLDLYSGRNVEDLLLEMFAGLGSATFDIDSRVAAWTVLNRLVPPSDVRARLASVPPVTPLVVDLQAAAAVVDVVPADREAVRWLMTLRGAEDGQWWMDVAGVVAGLTPPQRRGLELRHLPVLAEASADALRVSRTALVRQIRARLGRSQHAVRREYGAVPGPTSEAFADHEADLVWGDLLVIRYLLQAMGDRRVVTKWFVQADADLLDTRSEHGGVLQFRRDQFIAVPFPPAYRVHDRKFYSSESLIQAMYHGLAHYHFHVQQHRNAEFAGPGGGDLQFADRLRPSALVLTFIDRDTLNVDYYQPNGVAVDLGMIRR